jgi:hypothetical protein
MPPPNIEVLLDAAIGGSPQEFGKVLAEYEQSLSSTAPPESDARPKISSLQTAAFGGLATQAWAAKH